MKNLGIIEYKKENKEKYMSFDDIFDLVVSSFVVGIILGIIGTLICIKSV